VELDAASVRMGASLHVRQEEEAEAVERERLELEEVRARVEEYLARGRGRRQARKRKSRHAGWSFRRLVQAWGDPTGERKGTGRSS